MERDVPGSARCLIQPTAARWGSHEPLAVALTGVTKRFGDVVAVDDITLEIGENRFYALLGPSGCGKTTTLRMIGGLRGADAGIDPAAGEDVTGLQAVQRPVNTVFQSYALFPHLTIFENVAFGLRRRKVPAAEVPSRSARCSSWSSSRHGQRKPGQLSGGQQQRVALARALINQPRGAAARRAARRARPQAAPGRCRSS